MKKQRLIGVFAAALVTVLATGCHFHLHDGNGRITSEERTVDEGFYGVVLEGVGDVNIRPGETYRGRDYAVVVTTDSNIQDMVVITTDSSNVYVDERGRRGFNPTKLKIDVYLPELRKASLKGVGNIKVSSGSVSSLAISLSGVGDIDAQNYRAQTVEVTHSGVGNVKTWAENVLTGKHSGIGDILYRGSPVKNISGSGIGKVRQL
ncbi:MAG: DUF2807 domain-containing protein [Treponema sp.]|nr:DUF2807 domain-containing protein [Treponema sp.]